MIRRKRMLLVVPSDSSRIRKYRIRILFIAAASCVFLAGIIGYFVPFTYFSLTDTEKSQKRALEQQNKALSKQLFTVLRLFEDLRGKVGKIEKKRGVLNEIDGEVDAKKLQAKRGRRFTHIKVDSLLVYVQEQEQFFDSVAAGVERNPTLYRGIPLMRPLPVEATVSYGFGKRKDPFTGDTKRHNGLDFVVPQETPVISPASGTVVSVGESQFWGKRVVIQHELGFTTVYAHLGSVKARAGAAVRKGEFIGTVGISGQSIGPHLHFEVRLNDIPVNPQQLFFPDLDSLLYLPS